MRRFPISHYPAHRGDDFGECSDLRGCLSLQRCQMTNRGDWMAVSDDAPGAANLPALLRRPHQFRGKG